MSGCIAGICIHTAQFSYPLYSAYIKSYGFWTYRIHGERAWWCVKLFLWNEYNCLRRRLLKWKFLQRICCFLSQPLRVVMQSWKWRRPKKKLCLWGTLDVPGWISVHCCCYIFREQTRWLTVMDRPIEAKANTNMEIKRMKEDNTWNKKSTRQIP